MTAPEERFTGRVEDYAKYRPGYPRQLLDVLRKECGLSAESRIADIASGTGLLAEVFLENGNTVDAVEPNDSMLEALQGSKGASELLRSWEGSAESTGLPDQSVNFVTIGQAMHWFDLPRARREFARILRPGGWCVIVYNERRRGGDPFHEGYEGLLQTYGDDYQEVQGKHLSQEQCAAFFQPYGMKRVVIQNSQELDIQGLIGRVVSSSYMPTARDARYRAMKQAVALLFEANQTRGRVKLEYVCALSFGHLTSNSRAV